MPSLAIALDRPPDVSICFAYSFVRRHKFATSFFPISIFILDAPSFIHPPVSSSNFVIIKSSLSSVNCFLIKFNILAKFTLTNIFPLGSLYSFIVINSFKQSSPRALRSLSISSESKLYSSIYFTKYANTNAKLS